MDVFDVTRTKIDFKPKIKYKDKKKKKNYSIMWPQCNSFLKTVGCKYLNLSIHNKHRIQNHGTNLSLLYLTV